MTLSDGEPTPRNGPTTKNVSADESSNTASSPGVDYLHPSSIIFLLIARVRSYLIPAIFAAVAAACTEGLATGIFDATQGPYPQATMKTAWMRAQREAAD